MELGKKRKKKKGIHNSHCCLVINTEVSERCLARYVWILQSICCAVLRITAVLCPAHENIPTTQEWRDADNLRVSGAHGLTWALLHMKSSQTPTTECLLLSGSFLVSKEFSLDSPLVNSTVPRPSCIRRCQWWFFRKGALTAWGMGTAMSSLTSCTA